MAEKEINEILFELMGLTDNDLLVAWDSTQQRAARIKFVNALVSIADALGLPLSSGDIITTLGYTPENAANKNANNGYAGLNSSALLPLNRLAAMTSSRLSGIAGPNASGLLSKGTVFDGIPGVPSFYANGYTKRLDKYDLSVGLNTVYTVPAEKKAIIIGATYTNQNGSGATVYHGVQRGGVDRRIGFVLTPATLNGGHLTPNNSLFIYQAGDLIRFSTTVTNTHCTVTILEFDSTSPLFTTIKDPVGAGDNLIYQVPSGKTFRGLSGNGLAQIASFASLFYMNDSGGSRTVKVYLVPSGETVRAATQIATSAGPSVLNSSVGNGSATAFNSYGFDLYAGDAIYINVDADPGGTQWAFFSGLEY